MSSHLFKYVILSAKFNIIFIWIPCLNLGYCEWNLYIFIKCKYDHITPCIIIENILIYFLIPRQIDFFFFTPSIVLSFSKYHIVEIRQYVAFSDWLLSLCNMHWRLVHIFSWLYSSFVFRTEWYSTVLMDHSLSIHLPKGILVTSRFGAIMNKAAINICIQCRHKCSTLLGKH